MPERKRRTLAVVLTTSNADVYTVPARFNSDVNSIYINNQASSAVTFSLDWYEASTTTYHTLAETVTLQPNSLLQITDYPLFLSKNDKIRGLSSANNSVNISISLEEYYETAL